LIGCADLPERGLFLVLVVLLLDVVGVPEDEDALAYAS
jgi:hypothetical protein